MKKRERVWEQEEKTLDKQSTLYGALSKEAAARIIAQNEIVRHSMAVTGEIVRRGIPGLCMQCTPLNSDFMIRYKYINPIRKIGPFSRIIMHSNVT